ncbi:MAG: 50S ribosomal protein L3 [Candidatus Omnitrophica bacterium]|nr:50S ribosomal protein L3 [Candidatus Omnitrophota bacterium]
MIREIYGKKIGMTQIFDESGNLCGVTLITIDPVCLLEKVDYPGKSVARIGCFKVEENKLSKVKKPQLGYFSKLGLSPYKQIKEVEIDAKADFSFLEKKEPSNPGQGIEESEQESKGNKEIPADAESEVRLEEAPKEENLDQTNEDSSSELSGADPDSVSAGNSAEPVDLRLIGVEMFTEGDIVDVRSKTKGKGFTGGMKRYNWKGQPGAHGSNMHRRPGSIGSSAYPARVMKGKHMPGHMGDEYRVSKNLKVVKIDTDSNLLFVKGSIPGSRGTVVKVKKVK